MEVLAREKIDSPPDELSIILEYTAKFRVDKANGELDPPLKAKKLAP